MKPCGGEHSPFPVPCCMFPVLLSGYTTYAEFQVRLCLPTGSGVSHSLPWLH